MPIIDTHAHIDQILEIEKALQAATDAGVEHIVAVGVDLKSNRRNLEIQKTFSNPQIHLAFGIHPGTIHPEEIEETLRFIRKHRQQLVAIGETGLDYWYKWARKDEDKKAEQRKTFERQLEIAVEFDLPIIIHSRGAWRDCLEMTKASGIKKALFHWYSGPVNILQEILDEGYYVSASPSIAYSPQSREAISYAPIDRTLIETDTPVFYQDGGEGFQSTPKDVFKTLSAYSKIKSMEEDAALKILNKNAVEFFNLLTNA